MKTRAYIDEMVNYHFKREDDRLRVKLYCYRILLNLEPQKISEFVNIEPQAINSICFHVGKEVVGETTDFTKRIELILTTIHAVINSNRLNNCVKSIRGLENRVRFNRDVIRVKQNGQIEMLLT